MNAALLTPSKYIKAVSLQGRDKTVTITGVRLEELERDDNTKETKGLISLAETQKKWVLNVTNVKCLVAMFGKETDDWLGKRVTLYPEPNEMSDSGFAIRVRGSPDLKAPVTFTLKLARKKPRSKTLVVTKGPNGNGHAKPGGAVPPPAPPAGEPPPGPASTAARTVDDEDSFGDEEPPPQAAAGDELEPIPGAAPL